MFRSLLLVLLIGTIYVAAKKTELYSDRHDDIDVDAILANDHARQQYYDCFMDKGICPTEEHRFFKGIFGEILETNCRKCTDKQKKITTSIKEWYDGNQPEEWDAMVLKFQADSKKQKAASKSG